MTKSQFTPERIRNLYFEYKEALGRQPTMHEFDQLHPGAMKAIKRGKYDPEIRSWNGFKKSFGEEVIEEGNTPSIYTPDAIRKVYCNLKGRLQRIPSEHEFDEFSSGALKQIKRGRYDSGITTWNQFISSLGESLIHQRDKWVPLEVEKAYNILQEKFGRQPTRREFRKRFSGALDAIVEGRYDADIDSWTGFVQRMGGEIKRGGVKSEYTSSRIKEAYYEVKENLGRVPKQAEFEAEHSGALKRIKDGRYDESIKTWNQFLVSLEERTDKKT